jgi:hypothetical protein
MTTSGSFNCKYCGKEVKWNRDFFDRRKKGFSTKDIPRTLNEDDTPHICKKVIQLSDTDIINKWEDRMERHIKYNDISFDNADKKIYLDKFISDFLYENEISYIFYNKETKKRLTPKNIIIKLLRKKDLIIVGKQRQYIVDEKTWKQNRYTQRKLVFK